MSGIVGLLLKRHSAIMSDCTCSHPPLWLHQLPTYLFDVKANNVWQCLWNVNTHTRGSKLILLTSIYFVVFSIFFSSPFSILYDKRICITIDFYLLLRLFFSSLLTHIFFSLFFSDLTYSIFFFWFGIKSIDLMIETYNLF